MGRTNGATTKKMVWHCRIDCGDITLHDQEYPSLAAAARGIEMSYNQLSEIAKGRTKMCHPKYKYFPNITIKKISNEASDDEMPE